MLFPNINRRLLLVLLLIPSLSLAAQELSITGKMDRTEIKVGERASIDLVVRTSDISQTIITAPQDSLQDFTIVAYQVLDTVAIDSRINEIHARMILTAWDSCLLSIPPIRVQLGAKEVATNSFVLKVIEPEVDLSKPDSISEIKEPWAMPYTLIDILMIIVSSPFFWFFLGLCILSVIALILHLYFKGRKGRKPISVMPRVSSIETALSAIDQISLRRPSTGEEYKIFFTELTNICREYLNEEIDIQAMEMTTAQILQAIDVRFAEKEKITQSQITTPLSFFLDQSDLAKFARFRPSVNSIDLSISSLRRFLIEIDRAVKEEKAINHQANIS